MRRGLVELDEAAWMIMQAEGLFPGWLCAWLAERGVDARWRMLAGNEGAEAEDAAIRLRIVAGEAVRRALPAGVAARALALSDPAREAWLATGGGERWLALPAGGLLHARERWLDALAGAPCRRLALRWDETGGMALEPGLSAVFEDAAIGGEIAGLRLPEEMLVAALRAREMRLRLAESCTGGMIAARICRVAGASAVLDRSWVTYANAAKTEELGVPAALIGRHGAVSREVVEAMVAGAGDDCARIAVSGIAGPGGGSAEKPVGTVWIAVALPDGAPCARRFLFAGGRAEIRHRATLAAMRMLLEALIG